MENTSETNALLLDGMENLEQFSDVRLTEYAVCLLHGAGALMTSSMSELYALAAVSAARYREDQAGDQSMGALTAHFAEVHEELAAELQLRSRPQ